MQKANDEALEVLAAAQAAAKTAAAKHDVAVSTAEADLAAARALRDKTNAKVVMLDSEADSCSARVLSFFQEWLIRR